MGGLHDEGPWYSERVTKMATPKDYAVGTIAALGVEHQVIKERDVPGFLVPGDDVLSQYGARIAKAVIDAVDAARATS